MKIMLRQQFSEFQVIIDLFALVAIHQLFYKKKFFILFFLKYSFPKNW